MQKVQRRAKNARVQNEREESDAKAREREQKGNGCMDDRACSDLPGEVLAGVLR